MLAHGCQHSEHLLLASWRDEGPKAVLSVAERERELHSVRRLLRSSGCTSSSRPLVGVLRCAWPVLLKKCARSVAETTPDVRWSVLAQAAMLAMLAASGCATSASRFGRDE